MSETADLREIYADKVFALAARPYIKPRDIFDLHWLAMHHKVLPQDLQEHDLKARFAMYPNETVAGWLDKADARMRELPGATQVVREDLQRWLPSTWPLDEPRVQGMIDQSCRALARGVELARAWPQSDSSPSEMYAQS